MILHMPLAKGLSRQKTGQEKNRQEKNRQGKKRVVSAFLIVFFMGFFMDVVMAQGSKKKMFCTVGLNKNNDKIGGKYEVQTRGRETAVSILESDQPLAGYRVTPDISGIQGRYQLSADLDGVEFTQNDLRSISVDEAGEPGSGEQTAIVIGMPITQYQSSSSSYSYLLPIFAPDHFVIEDNFGEVPGDFNYLHVRMLAYHLDRHERQWVQARMSYLDNRLLSVTVSNRSVRVDRDSRYQSGSRIFIDLYDVDGRESDTGRTVISLYAHPLAKWFIQAARERNLIQRFRSLGHAVDPPMTFEMPSFPDWPTSEIQLTLPSAVSVPSRSPRL